MSSHSKASPGKTARTISLHLASVVFTHHRASPSLGNCTKCSTMPKRIHVFNQSYRGFPIIKMPFESTTLQLLLIVSCLSTSSKPSTSLSNDKLTSGAFVAFPVVQTRAATCTHTLFGASPRSVVRWFDERSKAASQPSRGPHLSQPVPFPSLTRLAFLRLV